MLSSLFYETHHPEIYHDHKNKRSRPFFEGWYFKIVDSKAKVAWAVIPGIYKGKSRTNDDNNNDDDESSMSQAFIMTLDGRTHKSTFHPFPIESFVVNSDDNTVFDISIGGTSSSSNRFRTDGITLNLPELKGTLSFEGMVPWPVTWTSPGIMGWYAYFPMECYHGLLSMDHTIHGQLQTPSSEDGPINFEGGRGYIEKDWGRNFPQNWIWLQANHFSDSVGSSISLSIARIPFYGLVFPGFIIGFWHQGVLHRFTTHAGGAALEKVQVDDEKVHVTVRNRTHRLSVVATRAATALLHMPTPNKGMVPRVPESVGSVVTVQLFDISTASTSRDSNNNNDEELPLLFEGTSHHGGLEVFGDISMLLC